MPCRDGGPDYGTYENPETRRRLDTATRAACEAFRLLTPTQIKSTAISSVARQWWNNHQEEDARRAAAERANQAREAARKAALSKLTPEERKALGLK